MHISVICPHLTMNISFFAEVGTNVGDISIWEVGSRERLVHKTFKVWDLSACSMPLQVGNDNPLLLFFSLLNYDL